MVGPAQRREGEGGGGGGVFGSSVGGGGRLKQVWGEATYSGHWV